MCLAQGPQRSDYGEAQGHSALMPYRLEPSAPQSQVKHSTTEPLRSRQWESNNVTIRHHKREPRGQSFPSRYCTQIILMVQGIVSKLPYWYKIL